MGYLDSFTMEKGVKTLVESRMLYVIWAGKTQIEEDKNSGLDYKVLFYINLYLNQAAN